MAKVVCVLYPNPVVAYPPEYARDSILALRVYPDSQPLPTPKESDFTPGQLLGCVSGELGLRPFLEAARTGAASGSVSGTTSPGSSGQ